MYEHDRVIYFLLDMMFHLESWISTCNVFLCRSILTYSDDLRLVFVCCLGFFFESYILFMILLRFCDMFFFSWHCFCYLRSFWSCIWQQCVFLRLNSNLTSLHVVVFKILQIAWLLTTFNYPYTIEFMTEQARKPSRNTRIKAGVAFFACFFGIPGIFWVLAHIPFTSKVIDDDAVQASISLIAIVVVILFIIVLATRYIDNKYPVHPLNPSAWPNEDAPRLLKRIFSIFFLDIGILSSDHGCVSRFSDRRNHVGLFQYIWSDSCSYCVQFDFDVVYQEGL